MALTLSACSSSDTVTTSEGGDPLEPVASGGAAGAAGATSGGGGANAGGGSMSDPPDNPSGSRDDMGMVNVDEDWIELVGGEWAIGPGEESYTCVRATVQSDIYVTRIQPVSPLGTHHTVVTAEAPGSGVDGTFPCGAGTNGPQMIFGSGVETDPFDLPPGVAVKLLAGQQVLLNLHLFNTSVDPLSGYSAIDVQLVDPSEVVHEAEMILTGIQRGLEVPPGESTQFGSCTSPGATTIFAVFPHMHQLGTHMRSYVLPADPQGEIEVLIDAPFDFYDQQFATLPQEVAVNAGDAVVSECSYANDRGETVVYGDSSDQEMCFTGVYIYPPQSRSSIFCVR